MEECVRRRQEWHRCGSPGVTDSGITREMLTIFSRFYAATHCEKWSEGASSELVVLS
jgi:hypothetical protein